MPWEWPNILELPSVGGAGRQGSWRLAAQGGSPPRPNQHPRHASSGGGKGGPFCGCCLVSADAAGVSDPLIRSSSVLSTGSMRAQWCGCTRGPEGGRATQTPPPAAVPIVPRVPAAAGMTLRRFTFSRPKGFYS